MKCVICWDSKYEVVPATVICDEMDRLPLCDYHGQFCLLAGHTNHPIEEESV